MGKEMTFTITGSLEDESNYCAISYWVSIEAENVAMDSSN